ncbi:MAG: DUF3047 domain-containing protein [Betaproteobacteria bacterium]
MLALALAGGADRVSGEPRREVIGAFSTLSPGTRLPEGWRPLTFSGIDRHTEYAAMSDPSTGVVMCATARASASGLVRPLDRQVSGSARLAWRWKADALLRKGDVHRREGDDYVARIYVTFRYSPERLSLPQRAKFAAARVLYGDIPHAALVYVWDTSAPVGTMVPNAYTDRVRMVVVESGPANIGQWRGYERDIATDYRQAFGEEPPPISGVAIMTDADNTGESASACYGDIVLESR